MRPFPARPRALAVALAALASASAGEGCSRRDVRQASWLDAGSGGALPWTAAAIAHAGVGTPPELSDGPRAAVDAALRALDRGADPVDAAVEGVAVLEDDPRFNAGTGARVRLDLSTVQMDAAVMRSDGRFGAVAGIERVRNPARVARAVLDTPHLVLAGDGATRFARTLGLPEWDPATSEAQAKARDARRRLLGHAPDLPGDWRAFDWRARWNFERPAAELEAEDTARADTRDARADAAPRGARGGEGPEPARGATAPRDAATDTVGVAVRSRDGRFGVALSTGGTTFTLRGRVGDVPVLGAGLYAGPRGAVACTGAGERIVEAGSARAAYQRLAAGGTAEEAAATAVDELRGKDIGAIAIGVETLAAAADRPMAWAARAAGSTRYEGPTPARGGAD